MPSRSELILRARSVNVDYDTYLNDSKLEQAVIYAEKNVGGDAVQATATLTSNATSPVDGDTVTVGAITYTFKDTLTSSTAANEVLVGGTAAIALDNLKSAVNGTGTAGTDYGSDTDAHTEVTATTNTNTTQLFVANVFGTEGNALVSTEVGVNTSFAGANFAGGADGTLYESQSARAAANVSGGANV